VIQSTTSTRDSGLYEYLLPKYPNYKDHDIKVVAVGTGQAIVNAKNCDGDLLIVHDSQREAVFMDNGYGLKRHPLMFNDFVIVGPSHDPARVNSSESPSDVFLSIARSKSNFISRSDSSGTHAAEVSIWKTANFDPIPHSGLWYYETGQGMGQSINIAIAKDAYIFTDRATWLKYKNKENHIILYQDKNILRNNYGLILVNYSRCKNINPATSSKLFNWLASDEAAYHINNYKINSNQVFFTD
tara:strand:- start:61 stop:789 length:729 start_codon:yes stop_codon:yes gene_type:complete